jgi:hypothetical protein
MDLMEINAPAKRTPYVQRMAMRCLSSFAATLHVYAHRGSTLSFSSNYRAALRSADSDMEPGCGSTTFGTPSRYPAG